MERLQRPSGQIKFEYCAAPRLACGAIGKAAEFSGSKQRAIVERRSGARVSTIGAPGKGPKQGFDPGRSLYSLRELEHHAATRKRKSIADVA
jgi:hypothetical protein